MLKKKNKNIILIVKKSTQRLIDGRHQSYVQISILIVLLLGHVVCANDPLSSNLLCGFICLFAIGSIASMDTSCKGAIAELAQFYVTYSEVIHRLVNIHSMTDVTIISKGLGYDDIISELIKSAQDEKDK